MFDEEKLLEKQQKLLFGKQLFDVELTGRCNKLCAICPRENFARKNQDMELSTFIQLCGWLPEKCDIMFAGYGEALLNKNIFDCLKMLKSSDKEFSVSLYTNGILLNQAAMQRLCESNLDLLQVSLVEKSEFDFAQKILSLSENMNFNPKLRFNVLYKDDNDFSVLQKK